MSRSTTRASVSALAVGTGIAGRRRGAGDHVRQRLRHGRDARDARSRRRSPIAVSRPRLPRAAASTSPATRPSLPAIARSRVTKITPAGAVDTSFGTSGTRGRQRLPGTVRCAARRRHRSGRHRRAGAFDLAVQPDGKIVVGGIAETRTGANDSRDTDGFVVRLLADGTPDAGFGAAASRTSIRPTAATRRPRSARPRRPATRHGAWFCGPNGKIVLALGLGQNSTEPTRTKRVIGAAQLNSDGTPDAGFGTGGIARSVDGSTTVFTGVNIRNATLDSDGSVLIASYESVGNNPIPPAAAQNRNRPFIHKFTPDGVLDTSWGGTSARAARHRTSGRPASRPASPAARRAPARPTRSSRMPTAAGSASATATTRRAPRPAATAWCSASTPPACWTRRSAAPGTA